MERQRTRHMFFHNQALHSAPRRPSLARFPRSNSFLLGFVMGKKFIEGVSPWYTARLLAFLELSASFRLPRS